MRGRAERSYRDSSSKPSHILHNQLRKKSNVDAQMRHAGGFLRTQVNYVTQAQNVDRKVAVDRDEASTSAHTIKRWCKCYRGFHRIQN